MDLLGPPPVKLLAWVHMEPVYRLHPGWEVWFNRSYCAKTYPNPDSPPPTPSTPVLPTPSPHSTSSFPGLPALQWSIAVLRIAPASPLALHQQVNWMILSAIFIFLPFPSSVDWNIPQIRRNPKLQWEPFMSLGLYLVFLMNRGLLFTAWKWLMQDKKN